jgi:hypothetical protein
MTCQHLRSAAVRSIPSPIRSGLPIEATLAHCSLMGTKSRQSIYGSSIRHSAERAAEARKEADRLACIAWNQRMLGYKGPAMPSPGDPQAEPTIGKAINGGFDLLEAKCNRCDRVSLVPLRALRQPLETPV